MASLRDQPSAASLASGGERDDAASGGFKRILNFRDVGETVNAFLGKKVVKEGLLFRSARLDDATAADRRRLQDEYHIRTVIDLRTKTEHINAAKKHERGLPAAAAQGGPAALAKSNDAFAQPLKIPGLHYREIKITGRPFEKFLLSQLSWWSFLKFLSLFLTGYRMEAISILGREVMLPRGLTGLGTDTLDQSKQEVNEAKALSVFIDSGALPVVVHCTQGKDRTGLVIQLVLMILGVPLKAIDYDYHLSDEALREEKESRLAEIREIGLTDEFGGTVDGLVDKTAAHLDAKYGGLTDYLDTIGFDDDKRRKMVELLAY